MWDREPYYGPLGPYAEAEPWGAPPQAYGTAVVEGLVDDWSCDRDIQELDE